MSLNSSNSNASSVGLVAIGRNEGDRLRRCLESARASGLTLVYVDSNSTDGSVALARSIGAEVVELDLSKPFTAARARNEGAQRLLQIAPQTTHIQFVDGDCELQPDWIAKAIAHLHANPKAAVVCGRRRERFPEATIYNQLCDLEWNTPVGIAQSCGGDALFRREAFEQAKGYNPTIIAGEEPDLCFRLRAMGHEVHRIDAEMTLHDAAMTKFSQWWKRNVRAGHAFAEGNWRHSAPPEFFWKKNVRSNFVWAALMPLWPLLWLKLLKQGKGNAYATFTTLSKLPQALGQLKFHWNRIRGKQAGLIEYK
jgi:GT2 family glycosyltransferase